MLIHLRLRKITRQKLSSIVKIEKSNENWFFPKTKSCCMNANQLPDRQVSYRYKYTDSSRGKEEGRGGVSWLQSLHSTLDSSEDQKSLNDGFACYAKCLKIELSPITGAANERGGGRHCEREKDWRERQRQGQRERKSRSIRASIG